MRVWHFGLAAVALAAAGALLITLGGGSGSQSQVTLDGVPAENLAAAGVRLLQPEAKPEIDAARAEETAKLNVPPSTTLPQVKETVLVRFVNDLVQPHVDRLVWAVNFDPATISAVPPLGPGQYGPFCGHPAYHVAFIDAITGELLTAYQRGGKNDALSDGGCPTPDPALTPTFSPES
jgi:hypothetical protein